MPEKLINSIETTSINFRFIQDLSGHGGIIFEVTIKGVLSAD